MIAKKYHKALIYSMIVISVGCGITVYQLHHQLPMPEAMPTRSKQAQTQKKHLITVHIAGAVQNPGVYQIPAGKRAMEVIDMIGGLTPHANIDKINLAGRLKDGKRLYIPSITPQKAKKVTSPIKHASNTPLSIHLNTATQKELERLPGVGPKTAARIIQYRQTHGRFKHIHELKNVKGIGQKTLEKLKPYLAKIS